MSLPKHTGSPGAFREVHVFPRPSTENQSNVGPGPQSSHSWRRDQTCNLLLIMAPTLSLWPCRSAIGLDLLSSSEGFLFQAFILLGLFLLALFHAGFLILVGLLLLFKS